ncbi:MAG TPA: copper resistance CopC family protein [Thermaerobacter sp.]
MTGIRALGRPGPRVAMGGGGTGEGPRRRPPIRRRPWGRGVLRAGAGVAILLVVAGLAPGIGAPRAEAHAALVGSEPERGARLEEPPREVALTFSEPVEADFSELTLTREGGGQVELGPVRAEGETLRAEVRGSMPAGEYVLRYRVLSQDGHPVEGEVPFSVTAAAPSPGAGTTDPQPAPPATGQDEPGGAAPPPSPQPTPQGGAAPAWLWAAGVVVVAGVAAWLITLRRRSRR